MGRPASISDEQILEAARAVFLEHGVQSSAAEIARRAGVSEGTIFRRFATKHELFMAAMGVDEEPAWLRRVEQPTELADQQDLEATLRELGHEMLDFFDELIPRASAIRSAMGHEQATAPTGSRDDDVPCGPPRRGLKAMTNFLYRHQRAGLLRPCDPEIAARLFLGAMHHYAYWDYIGFNDFMPMPRPTYVRGVVDALIRGLAPMPLAPPHRRAAEPDSTEAASEK